MRKTTKLLILILAILFFIPSCQLARTPEIPPVRVVTTTVPVEIYAPPPPADLQLEDVTWFTITRENYEERFEEIERIQGPGNLAIFAVITQDYEAMAYNMQEIKRYALQMDEIIQYYMEATKPAEPEDWASKNAELQQNQQEQLDALQEEATEPEPQRESFWQRILPW